MPHWEERAEIFESASENCSLPLYNAVIRNSLNPLYGWPIHCESDTRTGNLNYCLDDTFTHTHTHTHTFFLWGYSDMILDCTNRTFYPLTLTLPITENILHFFTI